VYRGFKGHAGLFTQREPAEHTDGTRRQTHTHAHTHTHTHTLGKHSNLWHSGRGQRFIEPPPFISANSGHLKRHKGKHVTHYKTNQKVATFTIFFKKSHDKKRSTYCYSFILEDEIISLDRYLLLRLLLIMVLFLNHSVRYVIFNCSTYH
jgi:hypothetical protein